MPNTDMIAHARSRRRNKYTLAVLVLIGIVVVALTVGAALFLDSLIQRKPYRMSLKSVEGQTVVQFARKDRGLISPEFPVNLAVETPQEVSLVAREISIPGCVVEFYDTTVHPGRFTIRIGGVIFDVMESGIDVGDKSFGWQPDKYPD